MANKKYTPRQRARRRKIMIRRAVVLLLTVIVTIGFVSSVVGIVSFFKGIVYDEGFTPAPYGSNQSKKVKQAKETEIPDFIEEDLIQKHSTARTGILLSDIKYVVVHYVGNPDTSAQNNRDYFNKLTTDVSSHFVVGLDGEIIQCVPLYEKSAASNERNKDSISIEVCHPDSTGKFNEETYKSLVKLTAWLCNEFSLDYSSILRHYDITGKQCPKYYVENPDEWDKFLEDVEEVMNE